MHRVRALCPWFLVPTTRLLYALGRSPASWSLQGPKDQEEEGVAHSLAEGSLPNRVLTGTSPSHPGPWVCAAH